VNDNDLAEYALTNVVAPTSHQKLMLDVPFSEVILTEVEQTLNRLAVRRLVYAVTRWLPGAAWWLRSLAFSLLLLVLVGSGAWRTGEPPYLLWLHIWAAALLLTALIAYDWLANQIMQFLREEIVSELPPEMVQHAIRVSQGNLLLRRQALISAGVGALTALLLGPVLIAITGRLTPFTYFIVFFGSALTTNLIYIPAMATVFSLLIKPDQARLYPLDPAQSRLVRGLEAIGQRIVWITAILATVGVIGPFLIPKLGLASLAMAVLVLTGAVLATGLQFVVQAFVLRRIVVSRRERTLNELQNELTVLYERRNSLSSEEHAQLESLLAMHEQTLQSHPSATSFSDVFNFVSPLLLPLLGLVVGSLNLPFLDKGVLGVLVDVFLK
jgi:hypothetical protein